MIAKLGEYIIVKKIGSGGMGKIFKARQPSLERYVAIKVLPRDLADLGMGSMRRRFLQEARLAARLHHPNVVQIYSCAEERGVPYFAMEYLVGEDLEAKLERGVTFTIAEAIDIVRQIALALDCAWKQGIVHRDIKPSNIMVTQEGLVKVMDFGLARLWSDYDSLSGTGIVVGTPDYMSPEQGLAGRADSRSDLYSLGVVFFVLVTGRLPFQAETPSAMIYSHIHDYPPSPVDFVPHLPSAVEDVILACLEKDPDDRYQDPAELLVALDALSVTPDV